MSLKDDGIDPTGGPGYSRYERTRVERNWRNTLKKERELQDEAKKHNGPPSYTLNMANRCGKSGLLFLHHSHSRLEIIADKVEKISPQERMSAPDFDPSSFDANAIRHGLKGPSDKWDLPMTRAQEVGWILSNPLSLAAMVRRQNSKTYPELDEILGPKGAPKGLPSADQTGIKTGSLMRTSGSLPNLGPSMLMPPHQPDPRLEDLNNRKYNHPRSFCPITKYADNFVSTMHCNPYSSKAARN